ncbi:hypothetical protein MMC08_004662 [Hypocenomyce scalaris]|nr:hypothetical protein [Hypocenomyce scalaris]
MLQRDSYNPLSALSEFLKGFETLAIIIDFLKRNGQHTILAKGHDNRHCESRSQLRSAWARGSQGQEPHSFQALTGQVMIQVKAFGLECFKLFTQQSYSSKILFPRVLGVEAVGLAEKRQETSSTRGKIMAIAVGGTGQVFDYGYAEYTCVPATLVQVIKTKFPRETLSAFPEMLQKA